MPRRPAVHTQADIARILRAYRAEYGKVRTRLLPDGSTAFEPVDDNSEQTEPTKREKEIVL